MFVLRCMYAQNTEVGALCVQDVNVFNGKPGGMSNSSYIPLVVIKKLSHILLLFL
jgi:hypothetical protein